MCVPASNPRFKRAERPDPCRTCGSYAVWNGLRHVAEVVRDGSGAVRHVPDVARRRARCSDRECGSASWTVYAPGAYPHRVFHLSVVASVVGEAIFAAGAAVALVASRHLCSPRSVGRWVAWVARLADPVHLARVCARLDPDGLASSALALGGSVGERAGAVLRLLDRLAALLLDRGVRLPGDGPGLARILWHQLVRFGAISLLTRSSPPLRVDLRALRL